MQLESILKERYVELCGMTDKEIETAGTKVHTVKMMTMKVLTGTMDLHMIT